jgi:hypothetical protein
MGTPIDLEKLRSIGIISKRTRPTVTEGRAHPETGRPWKAVTTEAGTVTEHATRDDRVDALVTPQTVPLPPEIAERIVHADA